jgi:hypothetical protein
MKHTKLNPADLAPLGAILALVSEEAATALATLMGSGDIADALNRHYGRGNWFVFWDEDLSGQPIRGTISLAYGKNNTLVIG